MAEIFEPVFGPDRPWGSFAEYYHDLDYIPEGCAWVPRDFPEEDSLYVWGPPVPPEFVENAELA